MHARATARSNVTSLIGSPSSQTTTDQSARHGRGASSPHWLCCGECAGCFTTARRTIETLECPRVDSFGTRRPRNGLDGSRHSPANVSCAAAEARFDNVTAVANETFKQTSNSGSKSSLRNRRALSGATTSEALGTEEGKYPGLR